MSRSTRLVAGLGAGALVVTGLAALAPAATAVTRSTGVIDSCSAPLPTAVKGAPATFKAGAPAGVYVWHDSRGWHLRATHDLPKVDGKAQRVVYRGVVGASKPIVNVKLVRLEPKQKGEWVAVKLPQRRQLSFSFANFGGVDGINFTAGCAGRVSFTVWKIATVDGKVVRTPVPVYVGKAPTQLTTSTTPKLADSTEVARFTVLRTPAS